MTYQFLSDLEEVIRTRAITHFGAWPDGLTMFVYSDGDFWRISLSAANDTKTSRYKAGVVAINAELRIEAEIKARRDKSRPGPGLAPEK